MSFLDRQVSDTQIKLGSRLWLYVISSIILFLLIVPSLIVIPMSFSDSQYLELRAEDVDMLEASGLLNPLEALNEVHSDILSHPDLLIPDGTCKLPARLEPKRCCLMNPRTLSEWSSTFDLC